MQRKLYDLKQDATFLSNCFDIALLQRIQRGEIEVCWSQSGFVCVDRKLGVHWLYYFLVFPYCFNINVDLPLFTNLIYTENKNVEAFKDVLNGLGFKLKTENLMLEHKAQCNLQYGGGGGALFMRKAVINKRL